MKFKIAGVIGLILSTGGGYFGYQQYASKSAAPDDADRESPETAGGDESGKPGSLSDSNTSDPFDDPLKLTGDEDFEEVASREPRKMGHPPKAAPISRHHAAPLGTESHTRHTTPSKRRESLSFADDTDDSLPPRMAQSEPDLDDEDLSGPVLEHPPTAHHGKTHRDVAATPGRNANRLASTRTPPQRPNAGPRIHSINDSDLPADITEDFADEKLEGYDLAEPRNTKKRTGHSQGPKISVIDGRDEIDADADERLDGFISEDATTRRAYSKTRIVRSTDEDAFDENPAKSDDDRDAGFGRATHTSPSTMHRRGTATSDGHVRANRLSSDDFADQESTANQNYLVLADDNFWKISRKQYGSARYYQALMRHNADRVSDPQKLRPGTQISTPAVAFLERKYPELIEKTRGAGPQQAASHGTGNRPRFEHPAVNHGSDRPAERGPIGESADGYFYSKSGEPMYRVGSDDTLTGIAQRHLGRASRWTEIYEQNQDILGSPDNLTLGTVIRLPSDASRLSLVPENERRR